jgi:hypothetical protein
MRTALCLIQRAIYARLKMMTMHYSWWWLWSLCWLVLVCDVVDGRVVLVEILLMLCRLRMMNVRVWMLR